MVDLLQPPPHVLFPNEAGGRRGCDRMVVGFTTTCAIGAYHPFNGEMYLMQHYVVKCLSVLQQVSGFLRFPLPIQLTTTYT